MFKKRANEVVLKTPDEIIKMRAAGRLVAETFAMLREHVRPGATPRDLDRIAEEFILKNGALALYKGYRGSEAKHPPFPGVICASLNEEICHGIPNGRVLKEGDIIAIDIGLRFRGYCGDSCVTYTVGQVSAEAQRLLAITQKCLELGIAASHVGNFLADIGAAIHDYADAQGVAVVHEWGGHGIGRQLHEGPSVSHTRMDKRGARLRPGMVFTIEPMINLGGWEVQILDDEWTAVTADGSLSAQFEHTVLVTETGVEVLTARSGVLEGSELYPEYFAGA